MDSISNHIFKENEKKPIKKEESLTGSPPLIYSDSSSSIQSSGSSNPPKSHNSISSPGMRQGFTLSPESTTTSDSSDSSVPSDSSGTPITITSNEFHMYAHHADSSSSKSSSLPSSSSSGPPTLQGSPRQPRSLSPSPPSLGSPPYYHPSPSPHTFSSSSSSSHSDTNGNSPPPSPFPSPSPPPVSPPYPARQGFLLQGIHLPQDVDTLCDAAAMAQLLIQEGDLGRFTGFKSPLAKRIARRLVGFLNEPYMWNEGAEGGERVRCEEARSAVLDLVGCEHYDVRAVKLLGERVEWIRPAPIIERIVGEKGGGGSGGRLGFWGLGNCY